MPQSDPVQLEGYGTRLVYADTYFRVNWDCGCEVVVRHPDHQARARVIGARSASLDAVTLLLRLPVPGPATGATTVELSFPRGLTLDVERLAARINGERLTTESPEVDLSPPDWVSHGRRGSPRPGGEGVGAPPARPDAPGGHGPDAHGLGGHAPGGHAPGGHGPDAHGPGGHAPGGHEPGAAGPGSSGPAGDEHHASSPAAGWPASESVGGAAPDPVGHEQPAPEGAALLASGPGVTEPAGTAIAGEHRGHSRLRQQPATPHPAPSPAPQPAPLPIVSFRADLSAWVDDPDWIGLYPTHETTRLIEFPSSAPAREHSSPPSE